MQSLLRFILRYHVLILFVLLETSAFSLVVAHHKDGGRFLHSANTVMGGFYSFFDSIFGYINLKQVNEELVMQNAELMGKTQMAFKVDTLQFTQKNDSAYKQKYEFMGATVINNSIHKPRNFITLNKGKSDGVDRDMGVISTNGVVGVVVAASSHYSLVISVLNVDAGHSAKLLNTSYFGSVGWNGRDPLRAELRGIPSHAVLHQGDTIVTSGYSAIFPEGLPVGKILSFRKQDGRKLYDVDFAFLEDFATLKQVIVVKNLFKEEQRQLEEEIK